MNIEDLLTEDQSAIVTEACQAVGRLEHYRRDGAQATRRRLEALYHQLLDAVCTRDVRDLRRYAAQIARERLTTGFELPEVEEAFSALERAIWQRAVVRLPPYDQAWGLGLACTALAHGRCALERAFDCVAPPAPYPDLTPLFTGTDCVAAVRSPEEMVFPV